MVNCCSSITIRHLIEIETMVLIPFTGFSVEDLSK